MRILVVTTSYPAFPGDASGHFVETEARLLSETHDVTVLTAGAHTQSRSRDAGGMVVFREDGGAAFGWPGVASRVRERPWVLTDALTWMHGARRRARLLPRFDRIIAHWAIPSALPIAEGLSDDLEIVSHGADARLLARMPHPIRRVAMGRLLRSSTRWRFASMSLRDQLSKALTDAERGRLEAISVVTAPLFDLPDVTARADALRRTVRTSRLFVCAGRLVESKRFEQALLHVANDPSKGARVVVLGDGPDRGRLERRARALGVDATFVGLTSREETLAWISAADALLHASHTEGLSTVVREAQALGTRVEIVP